MPHRNSAQLGDHLEALLTGFPMARSLSWDPLGFVRPFRNDPRAAEIAGVFAATVAVGNVKTIHADLQDLFQRMGGDPRGFLERFPSRTWRFRLAPWRHRWIRADQMGFLALRLREVYENFPGGLQEVVEEGMRTPGAGSDMARGLDALSRSLRHGGLEAPRTFYEPPPGYAALFPSPLGPGHPACKRAALFVRWMVRRTEPDLGLWTRIPPASLRIPLDTHIYWIARHLGLTRRKARDWTTVEEITEALRALDPWDPVRFDFALAHTGISGDCPKRRDISVCGRCAVQPDCDLWAGRWRRTLPAVPAPLRMPTPP